MSPGVAIDICGSDEASVARAFAAVPSRRSTRSSGRHYDVFVWIEQPTVASCIQSNTVLLGVYLPGARCTDVSARGGRPVNMMSHNSEDLP